MGWEPKCHPLTCPFCGQACGPPTSKEPRTALREWDDESFRAPCGCGAFFLVATESYEEVAQIGRWGGIREVEVRSVPHVDFYSVSQGAPDGEWDGDWADAIFWRLPTA